MSAARCCADRIRLSARSSFLFDVLGAEAGVVGDVLRAATPGMAGMGRASGWTCASPWVP
jgi:hypothetical protein